MAGQEWTVSEAKARLSEVLRRTTTDGPQIIGTRDRYVVLAEADWLTLTGQRQSLGAWLVENLPRGAPLQLPDRRDPQRPPPFADETA